MRTFQIRHLTRYQYDRPVTFGVHSLMIRPRDGHDMRILDSSLGVTPQADVRWAFDTFGNSVTHLTFHKESDELVIVSELKLSRHVLDEPVGTLARTSAAYPFAYDGDDSIDLAPYLSLQYPQDRPVVDSWIADLMPEPPGNAMEVLDLLGRGVHETLAYRRREEYGVQTPRESLAARSGTCRDFAFLFMEAARTLGFAARFVTGYLYSPGLDDSTEGALEGAGATHAWADIFIPGAGWVEFDPTNQIVAGRNLIRVASTRTPAQAAPVSGSYAGNGAVLTGMDVKVGVSRAD
ncbi:MAG: transglutaminase family protein [Salinarimonadaceae bacterium]|nr:MAG: transglutaminase family protein [Salinarimonadaceae bacterium]